MVPRRSTSSADVASMSGLKVARRPRVTDGKASSQVVGVTHECCFELLLVALDHTIGATMITGRSQALKHGGEPEEPEELRFKLSFLIGCDAAKRVEARDPTGEEGRGNIFHGDSLEGTCLRPWSISTDGGEAVAVRSGWGKRAYDVKMDVLKTTRGLRKCPER